jgi:hypothetical protein
MERDQATAYSGSSILANRLAPLLVDRYTRDQRSSIQAQTGHKAATSRQKASVLVCTVASRHLRRSLMLHGSENTSTAQLARLDSRHAAEWHGRCGPPNTFSSLAIKHTI